MFLNWKYCQWKLLAFSTLVLYHYLSGGLVTAYFFLLRMRESVCFVRIRLCMLWFMLIKSFSSSIHQPYCHISYTKYNGWMAPIRANWWYFIQIARGIEEKKRPSSPQAWIAILLFLLFFLMIHCNHFIFISVKMKDHFIFVCLFKVIVITKWTTKKQRKKWKDSKNLIKIALKLWFDRMWETKHNIKWLFHACLIFILYFSFVQNEKKREFN